MRKRASAQRGDLEGKMAVQEEEGAAEADLTLAGFSREGEGERRWRRKNREDKSR